MYKVLINDQREIEVHSSTDDSFQIEDSDFQIRQFDNATNQFTVVNGKAQYKVNLLDIDPESKTLLLKVNGLKHKVQVKDRFDILLEKMGFHSAASKSMNQIKAPMPGLINDISVAIGDEVNKGDKVLVLEAMKMENVIKSPGAGTVKDIKITKGESVDKNQVLIEF